jgi:peptidoglycan/LPS O-acetylase OafA/YrhL
MLIAESKKLSSAPRLPNKIPALDGLRGLSILLVVFAHAVTTSGMPALFDKPYFASLGNIGVRIFFVISGFLITTLLIREQEISGRISLKAFYIRRAFRIFPALFAYIGLIWAFYLLGLVDLRFHMASRSTVPSAIPDLLHAVTFTYNYVSDYVWYFNHLWSLSVEEQFYFLWPLTFLAFGPIRAGKLAIVLILLTPFVRWAMLSVFNSPLVALSREFQAVVDSILIGCVASIYFNRIMDMVSLKALIYRFGGVLGGALILGGYLLAFYSKDLAAIVGQSLANIGAGLFLLHVVINSESKLGYVLRFKGFVWLGLISYSLYLWQQPFLFFYVVNWATSFPVNIALAFVAAIASYFLIEKPALAIRHRIRA